LGLGVLRGVTRDDGDVGEGGEGGEDEEVEAGHGVSPVGGSWRASAACLHHRDEVPFRVARRIFRGRPELAALAKAAV
jgi:hypothetical protein